MVAMRIDRIVVVIAADRDDASSATVCRDVATLVVTPRSNATARGARAAAIVSTDAARALPCYEQLLAAALPSLL